MAYNNEYSKAYYRKHRAEVLKKAKRRYRERKETGFNPLRMGVFAEAGCGYFHNGKWRHL